MYGGDFEIESRERRLSNQLEVLQYNRHSRCITDKPGERGAFAGGDDYLRRFPWIGAHIIAESPGCPMWLGYAIGLLLGLFDLQPEQVVQSSRFAVFRAHCSRAERVENGP